MINPFDNLGGILRNFCVTLLSFTRIHNFSVVIPYGDVIEIIMLSFYGGHKIYNSGTFPRRIDYVRLYKEPF